MTNEKYSYLREGATLNHEEGAAIADEIERLTAERDDALKVCAEWGAKEYRARLEIERLRAALDEKERQIQATLNSWRDAMSAHHECAPALAALQGVKNAQHD